MNRVPTDGQLDAGAIYDPPSETVLDFGQRCQDNIATAIKRIQGAIICLDRALAADMDINDTVRIYDKARELHDALDETRKRFSEKIRKLSEDTIPKLFMAKKQTTVTLLIGNVKKRVTVSYRVSASMPDKDQGLKWLRKHKHGDMIVETVNAQTLGAWINNDYLKKNIEPPDVFKVSTSPYTSITTTDR